MLYPWVDWHRASVTAWLKAARLAASVMPLAQVLHPPRELFARTLAAGAVSERPLETLVAQDAPFPVACEVLTLGPFARLLRLRGPEPHPRRVLLMAPHSGYATAVISPLVTELLALGEVMVTDWVDARLVPASAGPFGIVQQIEVGLEAARALGGPAHLVALSQSGPATLVLAALLARDAPELRPASVTFLGCQLDPSEAPTPLQQILAPWPRDLLTGSLTTAVGAGYPGAGRRVYPSLFQLLAYGMASPHLYADVQHGLLRELATGGAGAYDRQHADMHSLLDVPAELFLQMLDWVLGPMPWSDGAPVLGGKRVELEALRRMPVLTLEAAEDELVGRGQTHGLGGRLPWLQPAAVTVPKGRHHDLFTGPGFAASVAPELRRFHAVLGG